MKFQNLEALIVVFVLIFVLMVMIPRCRKSTPTETATVTTPTATPQVLPQAGATNETPPTTAPEQATPAAPTAPATTAPAVTTPAAPVVANVERVSSPEAFARKLTPKPMNSPTKRPAATASAKEETVPFNPDGGGTAESNGATFYTVIADVKLRAQPGVDGKIIGKLPKDIAVTYLNVRTDKTQKLTIDNIPHDEPWLKIRTKKGTVGWVYGGTVRGYKK